MSDSRLNGAEQLARALLDEGVDTLFGYPGGAILPFYDALYSQPGLRHILTRHEQAAVFAADAYARVTGKAGVCVATSGPGATNLVTGIANAFLDSVPIVCLTGQVPTNLMGSDAFQEVDILGMTMPIVKHSWLVRDANDLYRIGREAIRVATEGRPGPVLIDLPKDVMLQLAEANYDPPAIELNAPAPRDLTAALELLQSAERPLIYGGGGIGLADAVPELRAFAEQIPAVLTLKGLGALPADHPSFLGMLGMHGLKSANYAVSECDLLICVGARFDDRVTGKLEAFCPDARVLHLDIDPAEVGKNRQPDVSVLGDLRDSLKALTVPLDIEPWRARCAQLKADNAWHYGEELGGPELMKALSDAMPEAIVTADVGQHQMWVAQHINHRDPRKHLTSGGLGAMGYGLPAAIGAQLAEPDALVLSINGDGGVQMNLQEFATLQRYDLPVRVVVVDNMALGMVRQWQELFLAGRFSETDLSDNPDFVKVGESFGIRGVRVATMADLPAAIEAMKTHPGPLLVHVLIDTSAKVWPFVPPGAPNSQMLEGTPS